MNQRIFSLDGQSLITPTSVTREIFKDVSGGDEQHLAIGRAELALILNLTEQRIKNEQDPAEIIHQLIESLHEARHKFSTVWKDLVPIVQQHPVASYFHNDPFSRWSFEKPRGYSGDAHLIDFIYGHPITENEIASSSALGKELYEYTRNAPSAVAVRERRDLLTSYVDREATSRGRGTEILTIASGHLREADRSTALQQGGIRRWVALDQDPMSVGATARDFHGTCVEAIDGSVRTILTKAHKLGKFDFIYAAGLYDYLSDRVAIKLTQRCLEMLKPDGLFLFANFSTEVPDDGYMETMMNWMLLLRSQTDMWNIIEASTDGMAVQNNVMFGENRNIIYGTIRRRG